MGGTWGFPPKRLGGRWENVAGRWVGAEFRLDEEEWEVLDRVTWRHPA